MRIESSVTSISWIPSEAIEGFAKLPFRAGFTHYDQLSVTIMRAGKKPEIRVLEPGASLVEQGEEGQDLFLLLDGVLSVLVDGREVAEIWPGALLGERAFLEGGTRTSTLRAVTRCRVAVVSPGQLDEDALAAIATGHHREEPGA